MISGIPQQEEWPVEQWSWDKLNQRCSDELFKTGKDSTGDAVWLTLEDYARYAQTQHDDSPLYLFDNHALVDEIQTPAWFPEDYMGLAGDDRPPHRWVAIGTARR